MKPYATVAGFNLLAIMVVANIEGTQNAEESNLRPRKLQGDSSQNTWLPEIAQFNVSMFLELNYLNESVADIFERRHDTRPQPVKDFCRCLKDQVRPYITERPLTVPCSSLTHTFPIQFR